MSFLPLFYNKKFSTNLQLFYDSPVSFICVDTSALFRGNLNGFVCLFVQNELVQWSFLSHLLQGILKIQNLHEYTGLRTLYLECNGELKHVSLNLVMGNNLVPRE